MARYKSTWQNKLERTRVILDPAEMIFAGRWGDPKVFGIFMAMLPYTIQGSVPNEIDRLARVAGVTTTVMKRWWPEIAERYFVPVNDESGAIKEWRLADLPWLKVQYLTAGRQTLRHLLEQLVAYWGNACAYCGAEDGDLQIEHIIPVVRGGTDDLTNLTLACSPCNLKKRTQTAAEFGYPHIHDMASRIQ